MPFAGERNTSVFRATGHETKATTDERLGLSARTQGHLEKCLCEIKVALLLYSGLMIFGLRSSLSV